MSANYPFFASSHNEAEPETMRAEEIFRSYHEVVQEVLGAYHEVCQSVDVSSLFFFLSVIVLSLIISPLIVLSIIPLVIISSCRVLN